MIGSEGNDQLLEGSHADPQGRVAALSRESLEQAATSEILRLISNSPNEVERVFGTIAKTAAGLCQAVFCQIFQFDGSLIHFVTHYGLSPEGIDDIRRAYPMPPGRASAVARAIQSGSVEQIPDVQADPEYTRGHFAALMRFRSVALQRGEAAIPPVGEALPNTEIFRRLAARFGFGEPCFKASDRELMDDAIDGSHPRMRGIRPSEIPVKEALRMSTTDGRPLALFDTVMPATPSGKVELVSDTLAERWGSQARLAAYRPRATKLPLSLISPASDKRISSTLLGFGGKPGEAPPLFVNPIDAAARGLENVKRIRVWNQLGNVVLPLIISDAVPPGVVASEKGAWIATSETGQTISALVSADVQADLAKGACYNDTAVEVEAWPA